MLLKTNCKCDNDIMLIGRNAINCEGNYSTLYLHAIISTCKGGMRDSFNFKLRPKEL